MLNPESFLRQLYDHFLQQDWSKFEEHLDADLHYICDGALLLNRDSLMKILRSDSWQGRGYNLYDLYLAEGTDSSLTCLSYHILFEGIKDEQEFNVEARETMVMKSVDGSTKVLLWHVSNR